MTDTEYEALELDRCDLASRIEERAEVIARLRHAAAQGDGTAHNRLGEAEEAQLLDRCHFAAAGEMLDEADELDGPGSAGTG